GTGAGGRPPEWRARAAARGRGPRPRLRRLQSGAALHIHGAQHGREERAPAWAARQRLCAQGTPATGDATRTHRAARSPTQHHARPASSYLCAELVRCTLRARHPATSRRTRHSPPDPPGAPGTRRPPPAPRPPLRTRTCVPSSYGARYELGTQLRVGAPGTRRPTRRAHPALAVRTPHHARPCELVPVCRTRTVRATSSAPSYESAHRALAARPAGRTRRSPSAPSTTPVPRTRTCVPNSRSEERRGGKAAVHRCRAPPHAGNAERK